MLEIVHTQSDAMYPQRFENGAETKLCSIREYLTNDMFKSRECLDLAINTYNQSTLHSNLEKIRDCANYLMENFNNDTILSLFQDIVSTDTQLYYDIINIIYEVVISRDKCFLGDFVRKFLDGVNSEILAIQEETAAEEGQDTPCDNKDNALKEDNIDPSKDDEE